MTGSGISRTAFDGDDTKIMTARSAHGTPKYLQTRLPNNVHESQAQ